jgi:hypothetical protein
VWSAKVARALDVALGRDGEALPLREAYAALHVARAAGARVEPPRAIGDALSAELGAVAAAMTAAAAAERGGAGSVRVQLALGQTAGLLAAMEELVVASG